jgi:hypothetical protein
VSLYPGDEGRGPWAILADECECRVCVDAAKGCADCGAPTDENLCAECRADRLADADKWED